MTDDASFASALQRAKAALDLRRPDEALRHLDRALASAPHDDRLWCLRAQAMLQLERPEEALEAARRAAGLDPTEEWSHRLSSVALVNLNRPAEAVTEAREAVRLAPHLPIVRVQLAQAMANLPEMRQAAYHEALAAVTLDPNEPECHLVVADTARKLGWTRQAEAAYRQVLAMDPGNAAAMNNLAVLRLQQGRTGEALSGFTAAAAHDPRMAVARRNVEVTAWKLVQRVTLALWITTWVASALTDDRGQSGTTDLPLGGVPSSGTLAPIFGALIIAMLTVQSWKAIPATARPFVVRLPLRRPWMFVSLVFAAGGAIVLALEAVLGAPFRHGGGAVGAFGAALIAAVCAVVGGSRAHALASRWRRR
ncbi:MAG TPA: tetratricopeptide repeat protein [Frankiaceae bacterium]|nr:tetratricopeptide repeat protein [Frankiaceae bacterium]